MNSILEISKYTMGMGDRFAQQGVAQLQACLMAAQGGVEVCPAWNKSNREHIIIGSEPVDVRAAADAAVKALAWRKPYYVDADHINLNTVDRFTASSDFFTIDVAEYIGKSTDSCAVKAFVDRHPELTGEVSIAGLDRPFDLSRAEVERIVDKYLCSTREAGRVYRRISSRKSGMPFVTEVSMDETDSPQAPPELLVILAAIAEEEIPIQAIAPKFSGRFNKGVDYVGDVGRFEKEFNDDIRVIAHAIKRYSLPDTLKLSVHSGSDKFSIYPAINRALKEHGCGVHVKTAGTTWLEEVIGLAEHGGEGLKLAKQIYAGALACIDELCPPYAAVIDINREALPTDAEVNGWTSEQYVRALRHNKADRLFNSSLRQLLHVGYRVAAKMGPRYLNLLEECQTSVARNVTTNLFDRHLKPLFLS